jgi:3-hydroxyisobutyrate dehydrogenase-like beta-hydroxyacid dehydrogenase
MNGILPCKTCYTAKRQGETMTKIGILHPGEMGISVAVSAINSGHEVYWVSQDRSDKTRLRAEKYKLIEVDSLEQLCQTLEQLCQTVEIIFSVCPPHAAETVAMSVLAHGFKGYYLDANAISPQRSAKIGQQMEASGIHFIDGGIIGGPAWNPKETWLYLSGRNAQIIADCFSSGPLETKIISDEIGNASALKMCYAAFSKGTTALLAAILATAESLGVRNELYQQWDMDDENFSKQVDQRVTGVTAKAWRFEGEMHEIASTFQEAGLPGGFHESAAEIYRRMASARGESEALSLIEILDALRNHSSA